MNKYIAIYVRRSVSDKEKGNNSLSIPAQISDHILKDMMYEMDQTAQKTLWV